MCLGLWPCTWHVCPISGVCGSEARPGAGLWLAVSSRKECVWIFLGPCVGAEGARRHQRPPGLSCLSSLNSFSVHIELLKSHKEADIDALLSYGPGSCLPDQIVNFSVGFVTTAPYSSLTLSSGLPSLV